MPTSANRVTEGADVAWETCRREPRADVVRIVEYTRFPRMDEDATARVAFTRDLSASGMCIGADGPEPPDALLRVTLRGVDGQPGVTVVDRVVWCSPAHDGRWWIGLESVTEKHLS
ncbi:MAG: PilZ domain-containing protein [Myxococcota bacterium]